MKLKKRVIYILLAVISLITLLGLGYLFAWLFTYQELGTTLLIFLFIFFVVIPFIFMIEFIHKSIFPNGSLFGLTRKNKKD